MNWSKEKEIIASSTRFCARGLAVNVSGSLGTVGKSITTLCALSACSTMIELGSDGGLAELLPPSISRNAVVVVVIVGTTICSQCCQSGRVTSDDVRQVW